MGTSDGVAAKSSRAAVQTGLHERRSGIRCLDNVHVRGRRKTEDKSPQIAAAIRHLVEPTSQTDPTFQTTLAFTRVTAPAVRTTLQVSLEVVDQVPILPPSTEHNARYLATKRDKMGHQIPPEA